MLALTIGLDPILLDVGLLSVSWSGLLTVLAVAIGIIIPARLAWRRGLFKGEVYDIALWAVPGGIIGARLFHVLDNLGYYGADPWQVLAFWEGGLALYGALLGGAAAGWLYAWLRRLPAAAYADLAAPGLLLGQMVGRVGSVINGEAYGAPTTLPWALVYTHPNAMATTVLNAAGHPAPLYEIAWDLAVLALVWRAWPRHVGRDGMLFLLYLSAYSLGRFVITFWRQDNVWFLGLQQAHIVALGILAVGLPLLYYLHVRKATPSLRLAKAEDIPGQRDP